MSNGNWNVYGVCPCGYKRIAPFGSLFHIFCEVCPRCGRDKDEEWELRTMRFVSDARIWNPSTWGEGHWEDKDA